MASDVTTETAAESAEDLAKRFAKLTERWRQDTKYSSRVRDIVEHPAYREVVAMGDKAVPLILADLEKNGGLWFMALREITGTGPVIPNEGAKAPDIAAAWVAWGREQGYDRWEHEV